MNGTVIKAENLGKKYMIRHQQRERYTALRDVLTNKFKSFGKRLISLRPPSSNLQPSREEFWALKDVSFEVKQGDRVGIIGRNGAGKTTLLKILSRITEPTTGRIAIKGRVASLLEVGTGFHPELTGRENIFLNGAILGMSKAEIHRKFDEIVDFAETSKFLDTPVKRYSSGMYVRLAFAVAAHLEPEILLVDEVLAVGDTEFQKKCLGKMEDIASEGRTVLFVSHSMSAITRLCDRAILLKEGCMNKTGEASLVVGEYFLSGIETMAAREWTDLSVAPGNDVVRLCAVRIRTEKGYVSETIDIRSPVGVEMEFEVLEPGHILIPNIHISNEEGVYLFVTLDQDPEWQCRARPAGHFVSTVWIPGNFFAEGMLIVGAASSTINPLHVHVYERDAVGFQVIDSLDGNSARGDYGGPMPGVIRPMLQWTTSFNARDVLSKKVMTSGQNDFYDKKTRNSQS
jgi:lipopolysaccharide transport system ATP-binding protein